MLKTTPQATISWVSIWGPFEASPDGVTFSGYSFAPEVPKDAGPNSTSTPPPEATRGGVGRIMSNQRLTDGVISLDVEFDRIDWTTTAEVVLHDDPVSDEMLTVGLGANASLVNVRHWTRSAATDGIPQRTGVASENTPRWHVIRAVGERSMLKAGRPYHLEISVQGSFAKVELDGVEIGSGSLPFQLSGKQIGLFCQSQSSIHFRHFRVESVKPLAFVVMQFSPPEYEELFNDVIEPVCEKTGLRAFRASETYYPGLVIADIQRQIRESRVVIAEITPLNPNVYYEIGYADAIGKPVILIADGGKLDQLPFDVRAFRTLFYENTIGGKAKVEKTLTEFLTNIMHQG